MFSRNFRFLLFSKSYFSRTSLKASSFQIAYTRQIRKHAAYERKAQVKNAQRSLRSHCKQDVQCSMNHYQPTLSGAYRPV